MFDSLTCVNCISPAETVGFKVFMVMSMKMADFCVVAPCVLVVVY
jgi:hypothetical protein